MFTSLSRNSYMWSPRSVVITPMGIPARTLKAAIDFFALVITGFCPVIRSREDQLVAQSEGVIAAPVERFRRHATEVAHAWQRDVHQPIQELVHVVAAQRGHHADGHTRAHLEGRDRLLRLGDHRLLPGDL